jgi:hypothetical protein
MAPVRRYDTDPPSPPRGRLLSRPIMDPSPHRNRDDLGIPHELEHPNDRLLVATWVSIGCPRWAAEELRRTPRLRKAALLIWSAVQLAAGGDKIAKEWIDERRHHYETGRRLGFISDRPDYAEAI